MQLHYIIWVERLSRCSSECRCRKGGLCDGEVANMHLSKWPAFQTLLINNPNIIADNKDLRLRSSSWKRSLNKTSGYTLRTLITVWIIKHAYAQQQDIQNMSVHTWRRDTSCPHYKN